MWLPKLFRKTITTSLDVVTKDKNKQPHRVMWLPKVSWLEPKEMHSSNQDNMEQCVSNALNVTSARVLCAGMPSVLCAGMPSRRGFNASPGTSSFKDHIVIWTTSNHIVWCGYQRCLDLSQVQLKLRQATTWYDVVTKSVATMWLSQVNQATTSDDVITKGVSTWSRYSSS